MWPEDLVSIAWKAGGNISSEQLAAARKMIEDAGLYPLLQRLGVRAVVVDPSLPPVTDDSMWDSFEDDGINDTVTVSDRFPTLVMPSLLPATIIHGAIHLYQQRFPWGSWGPDAWRGLEVMAYTGNLIFHLLTGERIPVFDGAVYGGAKKALDTRPAP